VAVDGGSGNTELGGDLGDGVLTLAVGANFVVHPPGQLHLPDPSFGFCPSVRPRALAAASPSIVRSDINACSNSAIGPMMEKNSMPTAVDVSMP
jgi:hypothetical protein